MAPFFTVVACIIIFFVAKKAYTLVKIKKIENDVISISKSTCNDILFGVREKTDDIDFPVDTKIMLSITATFAALQGVYNFKIQSGTFADHYANAAENMDYGYTSKVHNYLAKMLGDNPSSTTCVEVFSRFIKNHPPTSLIYNIHLSYEEYYRLYINWIRKLDSQAKPDEPHWIELTDDSGVKRAYSDGIPPKKLAEHVLTNTSITDIR